MAQHTTVFSQVNRMVPKALFDSLATKHQAYKGGCTFTAHAQFSALLLAQLQGLMPLRKNEHATRLAALQRQGVQPARRSTLADANRHVHWTYYQDLFFQPLPIYDRLLSKHEFDLPGKLFSLDVTSISVPISLFLSAHFRARKGAVRLHTLLDHDPMIIVDLYRQRWQIVLFFKWIKQHLRIKTFFGTDQNTVLTQI